jgi:hypothetical protein
LRFFLAPPSTLTPKKTSSHNIFVPCMSIASINSSQHNFFTDSVP